MASALMPEMLSILRDIYESEELKIDSVRSKTLKQTVDTLCVTENDSFRAMFVRIMEDMGQRKDLKGSPHNIFVYIAERLPVLLKDLGKVVPGSITDPILWQVWKRGVFC